MAFVFNWPRFSDQFHADARLMLENALNKGSKPPIIADKIEVVELEMGMQPPELEIRDIGDLTMDQFRGIFRLSYSGDAHIVLRTKVQANPLTHKKRDLNLIDSSRSNDAAQAPLVVPMNLRLSNFRLNSYVVLVVSKQKGITLVFKTDPLQNVDVNSTFDRIGVIQKYIQKEIEGQLREMFREDLPSIIHKLSQQWFSSEIGPKPRIEVPYARKFQHHQEQFETASAPSEMVPRPLARAPPSLQVPPTFPRPVPIAHPRTASPSRSHLGSLSRSSHSPRSSASSVISSATETASTFPEIEEYDPTYGLRPEDLPAKSDYSGFAKLWTGSAGLGELAEEPEVEEEWGSVSIDPPQWDASLAEESYWESSVAETPPVDYETVYAVGGGTVTRPRVYHSQAVIKPPSDAGTASLPSGIMTPIAVASRSVSERGGFANLQPNLGPRASATAIGLRVQTNTSTSALPVPLALGPYPSPLSAGGTSYFNGWDGYRHSDVGPSTRPTPGPSPVVGLGQASALSAFYSASEAGAASYINRSRPVPGPSRLSMTTQPNIGLARSTPVSRRASPPESARRVPVTPHRPNARPSRASSGLTYSGSTPPSSEVPPTEEDEPASPTSAKSLQARRLSISQRLGQSSPFDHLHIGSPPRSEYGSERGIVLKPAINSTVSQLATLSHSHHTLSPYTRSMSHFAVRSGPPKLAQPLVPGTPTAERPPVRARRRRTYRLGGAKEEPKEDAGAEDADYRSSPRPTSDYSDYFHTFPTIHEPASQTRRRVPYASP